MLPIGRKNDPPHLNRLAQAVSVGLAARGIERRNETGDHTVALRDEYGLSLLSEVNVLGELSL